jgi:hypothetical protein
MPLSKGLHCAKPKRKIGEVGHFLPNKKPSNFGILPNSKNEEAGNFSTNQNPGILQIEKRIIT